ncbi:AAA family ATPase [Pseudoalteromonas nigrifaciens]|uniref:AAA family ATPase n=1 Tax=Pseudoalteromonas nigrifaciens TaxID=28109 RepID=UPI0035622F6E
MAITFIKLGQNNYFPDESKNTAYLQPNNWDDFDYKTLFSLVVFDTQGNKHHIGNVKIGFVKQESGWTSEKILSPFTTLPDNFYSLGQDADYYRNLVENLSPEIVDEVLTALGDVSYLPECLVIADDEQAFHTSLLRSVSRSTIEQQFRRIIRGEAVLTEYNFSYKKLPNKDYSGIEVNFEVKPNTKPSSNIHILIGRNGVGKTTLLNNMVNALLPNRGNSSETGVFVMSISRQAFELPKNYFAGVISVSFSAFDPFDPPNDQTDANAGMQYYYVGLKKRFNKQALDQLELKDINDLCQEFTSSLKLCFALTAKKGRWIEAIKKLESDSNFAAMDLCQLIEIYDKDLSDKKLPFTQKAIGLFRRMSSGHAIVLLTMTRLVETVEEKTLVLLDEPESHLHPPLLSAFTRALSDLLVNRNGVAIIATHSPVVLQEVPKSCVSIIRRTRLVANVDKPEIETFAENVGILTREVFGLEVSKSGFHNLLETSASEGKSYEEIEREYNYQLGFEGKVILRSLILVRDSEVETKK